MTKDWLSRNFFAKKHTNAHIIQNQNNNSTSFVLPVLCKSGCHVGTIFHVYLD